MIGYTTTKDKQVQMSFFSSLRFPSKKQKEANSNANSANNSSSNLPILGTFYKNQSSSNSSSLLQKQQREREMQKHQREMQLQMERERQLQEQQKQHNIRQQELAIQQANERKQILKQKRSNMYLNNESSKSSVRANIQEPEININQNQQPSLEAMFLSEPFVSTSLVKGSFKTIVKLPKYVDLKEWVALNVFEFYTNLSQFYSVIQEYVTPEQYPTMNAGPGVDYLWLDANNKNIILPANQYIDLALSWINNKITDRSLFPTSNGIQFAANFPRDVQRIMIQMFRIIAHIYYHHFDKIVHLALEAHWNSFFAHFISFINEYRIIDEREIMPLRRLITAFEAQGRIISSAK